MHTQQLRSILALVLLLAAGGGRAHEHHPDWEDDDRSYDRARRAIERGEILSLAEIYARVAKEVPGRILKVELEMELGKEHGLWIYELKVLDPGGRLREVKLDARTGKVLSQEDQD